MRLNYKTERNHYRWIARGEQHYAARFTADQVRALRKRYAAGGVTYRQLAAEHGVSHTTMRHLVVGKNWKSVT